MKKTIVVLDTDKKQCRELCSVLGERHFQAISMHSLESMEKYVQDGVCKAVIMDINTVTVDNKIIKELTKKYPRTFLFCLSKDRFHPHLEEALRGHIFACISKPIDPEELFDCLRVIEKNDAKTANPPRI
jgi:DNA-binding NtrC family response regulator